MAEVTPSGNDTVSKLIGQYEDWRKYFRPVRDDFVKDYKQYRSILDVDSSKDYYKWRSKLFIPATARAVDGLLPDLLLTLFGPDPFFGVGPREPGDVMAAKLQESLLAYQFDCTDFFNKTYNYLKQYAIYGSTFGKVFWKKETVDEIIKFAIIDSDGVEKKIKTIKSNVLIDQPWFEPIDIFALVWGKRAISLQDTAIYHRSEKTIRELKETGVYGNIKDLERAIVSDKSEGKYEEEVRRWSRGLSAAYSGDEGDERRVELLEYWNADRTETSTIAGQRIMVRPMRDNPYGKKYDPFVQTNIWGNPFEMLGVGIPEKVKDIQNQLNTEVNQRLDNRNLRQNFILKVRRGANINTRNLLSKPGAVWLTDDMTALEVISMPDTSSTSSFMEENMLEGKCEEITGVTKYATGGGVDSRRTATEVSLLTRMASKSFALHLRQIEEQFIKPVIRKFMYLNSKFMEKEQFVRIIGDTGEFEFIKISPSSVSNTNYDLIAQGSSQLTDKNLKVQQMIQYMQLIVQDPTMIPFKKELTKRIWEAWGNKDFNAIMQTQIAQPTMPVPPIPGGPPQTMGGQPVNPTEMRMPSPMEGMNAMMMGGGGTMPQQGGY